MPGCWLVGLLIGRLVCQSVNDNFFKKASMILSEHLLCFPLFETSGIMFITLRKGALGSPSQSRRLRWDIQVIDR